MTTFGIWAGLTLIYATFAYAGWTTPGDALAASTAIAGAFLIQAAFRDDRKD